MQYEAVASYLSTGQLECKPAFKGHTLLPHYFKAHLLEAGYRVEYPDEGEVWHASSAPHVVERLS